MKIEVYKTMVVGSYHAFIDDVQYWCTPANNYVYCKRPLKETSKGRKLNKTQRNSKRDLWNDEE